jgi:hypothetical protein
VFSGGVGSFVGIGGALLMVPIAGKMYNLRQLQVRRDCVRRLHARAVLLRSSGAVTIGRANARAAGTSFAPRATTC